MVTVCYGERIQVKYQREEFHRAESRRQTPSVIFQLSSPGGLYRQTGFILPSTMYDNMCKVLPTNEFDVVLMEVLRRWAGRGAGPYSPALSEITLIMLGSCLLP